MSVLGGLRLTSLAALLGARRPGVPRPAHPATGPGTALTVAGALDRARASGHPDDVVAALARRLPGLAPDVQDEVVDPLGRAAALARAAGPAVRPLTLGGARARQVDGTTCGSSVLGLLAAAGDPVLALWLVTGTALGAAPGPSADAAGRWRALQRVVKARTGRGGLGPFPWPAALGTPPWGAARTARYAGVRYTHRVVDGAGGDAVLDAALDAAARGVPVPLFTGGDLSGGLAAAVPRHVVLLAAADADRAAPGATRSEDGEAARRGARRCWVYEPSSGTVHRLDAARLSQGARDAAVRRALGGWPHVVWALLPDA